MIKIIHAESDHLAKQWGDLLFKGRPMFRALPEKDLNG
jgi:hypothetical protein